MWKGGPVRGLLRLDARDLVQLVREEPKSEDVMLKLTSTFYLRLLLIHFFSRHPLAEKVPGFHHSPSPCIARPAAPPSVFASISQAIFISPKNDRPRSSSAAAYPEAMPAAFPLLVHVRLSRQHARLHDCTHARACARLPAEGLCFQALWGPSATPLELCP